MKKVCRRLSHIEIEGGGEDKEPFLLHTSPPSSLTSHSSLKPPFLCPAVSSPPSPLLSSPNLCPPFPSFPSSFISLSSYSSPISHSSLFNFLFHFILLLPPFLVFLPSSSYSLSIFLYRPTLPTTPSSVPFTSPLLLLLVHPGESIIVRGPHMPPNDSHLFINFF